MRHAIWEADDFFLLAGKRIDMDPVVVELKAEPLPIVWGSNFTPENILGNISGIRIENGKMTGEVEWTTEKMDDEKLKEFKCRLGGFYNNVIKNPKGDQVLGCTLRCVSVMFLAQTPGFPKVTK